VKISPAALRQAQALVARRLGLHFSDARMADMERGLAHAVRNSAYTSLEPYLAWLAEVPDEDPELRRLAAQLTIGETHFFRDGAAFDVLERHILASLIATRRAEGVPRLRLWSAACATGEEPYSLAIQLDRLLGDRADWSVTILATDINTEALEVAQRGIYRDWSFRGTPAWVRERYFRRQRDQGFELDPRIRGMVTFAPLNLAADGYPSIVTNTGAMDLVFCRNVLMYFTADAQRATIARLQRSLVAGGWLLVGPAESSVELLRPLVPVNYSDVTFYRKDPEPAVATAREVHPGIHFASSPAPIPAPATLPADRSESDVPCNDLARARALADQGSLDEALRLCEAARARNRLDPEPHLLLAAIRQERGEIPAALEALRGALYLAPDSASAHFLLGSLLLREGRPRRARRSIETVVALLDPRPRDELVPGGDGLTAGRLLETARAYLEATG
jgi:chemotaxis protein methyltransferase CheR